MSQLQLIPEQVIDGTFSIIPLSAFPEHFPGRVLDTDMVESIAKFGVLQPILCKESDDGTYVLCDGRSRVLNSRSANRETIPAYVFPAEYSTQQILTIVANTRRSENFVTDVLAIKEILEADKEVTLQQICTATGLSSGVANQRMKLLNLIPDLFNLLKSNHLSQAISEKMAGLTEAQQKALYQIYLEHGKITNADIRNITAADATQDEMEFDTDDEEEKEAIKLLRDILKACRLGQARLPSTLHARAMEIAGEDGDFDEDEN